jgi:2-oxoglutarate dehydrogenase E2 component (dihydrolipoamide succinyltransferase)
MINIVMPQAGESVTSGVVSRWLKNPGDFVKRDEAVVEIETDKVSLEVPSPSAGVLGAHAVKAGDTVAIGQVLCAIDQTQTAGAPSAAASSAAASSVASGAAPAGAAPGSATGKAAAAGASAPTAPPSADSATATDVRATPLAKKLAEEQHVDLSQIVGTGAGGRIREQDVMAFVQARTAAPASNGASPGESPKTIAAAPSGAPTPSPSASSPARGARTVTRDRVTPLRQRIAQRLVEAQHTAAMLTTFNEVDMGAVMDLRKQYKEEFEKKHAIGLGFMGFFVRAVTSALRAFPLVNSSLVEDEQGSLAVQKHSYCDVAIAVSTPKGLVVPVLRNAEALSLAQIESGIKELATKARDGKLTLEDMQGGTFTITNGGVFGSLMSTPILNPPQSGILGMHTIKNRPAEWPLGSGQVALRPMMYLALSYDHRIIDGAEAVQFLVKVKQAIEDPQRLLLEI